VLAMHRPDLFMIKIKQDDITYTVTIDKQESTFIKHVPEENIRLLEYLVYSLGLNSDTCKVDITIKPK
jgi:hypothetical protein